MSGGDIFMSQHLRKRLQTHTVRQADRRGVGMPRQVERELFVDAAFPSYVFKAVVDGIQRRQFEQVTISSQTPVFIQQEQRIRKQFDDIFRFGLLAVAADPPLALRILLDPVIGQRGHIRIADAREAGEQEHIAVIVLTLIPQLGSHHTPEFIFR